MQQESVLPEYAKAANELKSYFEKLNPTWVVCVAWDFDRRCISCRFDQQKRPRMKYLLKNSCEILSDFTPPQVTRMLESAHARRFLNHLTPKGVVLFTKSGFKILPLAA